MRTNSDRLLMIVTILLTVLPVFRVDAATAGALQQADATLIIHNNSDETICHVFITVSEATTWGRDWLGEDNIAPGGSYSFTLPAGVYYVLIVDCKLNMLAKARNLQVSGTIELFYKGGSLSSSVEADSGGAEGPVIAGQLSKTLCYSTSSQDQKEQLRLFDDSALLLQALMLRQVAGEHSLAGQHEAALVCYQDELAIYQQIDVPQMEAMALNDLGATYRHLSQYQKALTYYLEALKRWQTFNEPSREAVTRDNIGVTYQYLRQYENALAYHHQALAIFQQVQDIPGEGSALNNLGLVESYLGHSEEALEYFLQSLEIWRKLGPQENEAITLSNIGFVYEKTGQHDEALDHFNQALSIFRQLGQRGSEGGILVNIGAVYDSAGSYQRALDDYHQALEIMQEIGDQEGEGTVLINIGFTFEHLENMDQALITYRQAIDVIETIQGDIQVDSLKSTYAAAQVPVYEHLIGLLWENDQEVEAFSYAERARARAFLDQIGNQQVGYRQGVAPDLLAEEQDSRQRVVGLQNTLQDERAKPINQQNQELLEQLSAELEEARGKHEMLLTRLKLESPEYASLVTISTLGLEEVQDQVLDEDTTLVEYFILEDRLLAWVIDQQGFQPVVSEISHDELRNQVEFLRNLIDARKFDQQVAADLYNALFAPLKPYIRHPNLVIVPHGVLNYLPFATLWDDKNERYLLEDYALTYAPSASVLKFILEKRSPDQERVLAMGNPGGTLLNAENEAKRVAELYNSTPLLRQEATESQIYTRAGQLDLLHLAAHGLYDPYNALYSRIELAPDDAQDGNLEVHEVFELDLTGTNLVVLSACQTALGEQSNGDELVGLARAFLYAGTPAVVTSLWNIDDEASGALMETFYQQLRAGFTNAEALRGAQLAVSALDGWSEPYFWAAFNLTGDYRGNGEPRMVRVSTRKPTPVATAIVTPTNMPTANPGLSTRTGDNRLCTGATFPLGLMLIFRVAQVRNRRRAAS